MYRLAGFLYRVLWKLTRTSRAFSSDGEDLILNKLFQNKKNGFYIDLGAYAPINHSNTYLFYLKGWSGILVDPRQGFKFWATLVRPRDEIFNIGVDELANHTLTKRKFYIYRSHPDNNTMSKQQVLDNIRFHGRRPTSIKWINFASIDYILKKSKKYPESKQIDLLSVDLEGVDYEIISIIINTHKIFPKVICVEQLSPVCASVMESKIYNILYANGYQLLAKTILSCIYVHNSFDFKENSPYFGG